LATLFIKEVPDDLYQALKERAARERRSISSETLKILEEVLMQGPRSRREVWQSIQQLRQGRNFTKPGPNTTEMLREDRPR
jgi:antitoxin FitA